MADNIVELSIIIVNYNTNELTQACLLSLAHAKQSEDSWEIILVDNGSTDGSGAALARFCQSDPVLKKITTILQNNTNVGFSAGNNLGIKQARGDYLLLLNSDTEVSPGAITIVQKRLFNRKNVGAATCKLVLPDGSIDPACHRGFPTPWAAVTYLLGFEKIFPHSRLFAQYHMGYMNMAIEHCVDAISGAFFMVKRDVVNSVGLLDEAFFMYGEDLDWAYRIRKKQYDILFVPDVSVLHKKKQSGRVNKDRQIRKRTTISFYQTMQLFYRKHYQQLYPFFVTWILLRLLDLRILLVRKD
jgi:GT2 family glycosyltransferase